MGKTHFKTRMFGDVPVEADGAFVTVDVAVGQRSIRRTLSVADDVTQHALDAIATLVDDLPTLDGRAREAMAADDEDGPLYVEHHLEELDDDVLRTIFGAARASIDKPTFLERLDLVGIGVQAQSDDDAKLVLDYSIGKDHTDYVLAVELDAKGEVVGVAMES